MRTAIVRVTFTGLMLCSMAASQTTAPPSVPAQKPSEPLAKPESDRGDERVLRQPALTFSNPDRDQLRLRIETALRNESSLAGTRLTVNVSDDAIDVSGNADTNKQRLAARRIVQSFAGNMRVRERISVAGASPAKSTADPPSKSLPAVSMPGASATQQQREPAARTELKNPPPDPKKEGDKSEDPRR